jgi:neutral amino acid transport system permease protein
MPAAVRALVALLVGLVTLALPAVAAADTADDESPTQMIQGTIRDAEAEPIEGVEITVSAAEGDFTETATTDAEGAWSVELPSGGNYEVLLDEETLGDAALRNPDNNPLTINVRSGSTRPALFATGEAAARTSTFDRVVDSTANGIKFGLIVAMTAVGLSLIFGTTGLINFAHGELVAFGAITAWFLNVQGGLPLWLSALIAVAAGAALGGALDRGMWRPLRRRRVGLFQMLVITIGLSLLLQNVLLLWFGGQPRRYADYVGQTQFSIGPFEQTPRDWTIMLLSVIVLVSVASMLQFTRMGKAMRAVSDNRDLAESSGIDVKRVILTVWILGGGLAALGGVFQGTVIAVEHLMGFRLLLLMFAGVILGGLGTAYGAMVGSLVVGLVVEISTVFFGSELKIAWALVVLIIVLLVRPQGILGRAERLG